MEEINKLSKERMIKMGSHRFLYNHSKENKEISIHRVISIKQETEHFMYEGDKHKSKTFIMTDIDGHKTIIKCFIEVTK